MNPNRFIENFAKEVKVNHVHNAYLINCQNEEVLSEVVNLMVKTIYCPNQSYPNDNCSTCQRIENKTVFDIIEIGNGIETISKEQIKNLISKISLTPLEPRGIKIYILNKVENMTVESANSILKILEEPPKNTIAILKTQNETKVISTILSRCQKITISSVREALENNQLINLVKSGVVGDILLFGQNLAKLEKVEIYKILNDFYYNYAISNNPAFAGLTLELIMNLEKKLPTAICIENFLIKLTEEL